MRLRRMILLVVLLAGIGGWTIGTVVAAGDAVVTAPTAPGEEAGEAAPAAPELTPEEKRDADIGKSAAEELEKKLKVVADSPDLARLNHIVETIRPFTQKPHQNYTIKVVEMGDINAFSLPGGYLYFTTGLLTAVESDDELAAVAGHEMSHVCLSHSRRMMSQDKRYSTLLGALLVAAILSNSDAVDPGAVTTIGSMVAQDALNHYGRSAELEADHAAVLYLRASGGYNPVAVLTVVEGLARLESNEGNPELGIYQSHPYGRDRVKAAAEQLASFGIPLERRRVIQSLRVESGVVTLNGKEIGELRLSGRVVFQPAVEWEGLSPVARAKRSAEALEVMLLSNLALFEISVRPAGETQQLCARGEVILTVTPGDAALHGTDGATLARRAMEAISLGFSEERVKRAY